VDSGEPWNHVLGGCPYPSGRGNVWKYHPVHCKQVIAPGSARRYAPIDGSSTRGGSTSVRGRVRSPHIDSQRAYSLWDRQTDGSRYRLMPMYGGGIIKVISGARSIFSALFGRWQQQCGFSLSVPQRLVAFGSARQLSSARNTVRRTDVDRHASEGNNSMCEQWWVVDVECVTCCRNNR